MLALGLLVLLHEGGHFFFAKLFGVRVSRFYLFFNPKFHIVSTYDKWVRRLLKLKPEVVPTKEDGTKEYVGTEYGIGWVPLGGYCAIEGMIDETNQKLSEEVKSWEFRAKPIWQRLLIMIGGVLVNFLLALFIYAMILFAWGESYIPASEIAVKFNDEAKALGFKDGDKLVSADGKTFKDFSGDLYRSVSTARSVVVERDGRQTTISLPGDLNMLSMFQSEPRFMEPLLPAVIDSVMPGTPADKLGLKKGDRILSLNGHDIDSHNTFLYEMGRLADKMTGAVTAADSLGVRTVTLTYQTEQTDTTGSNVRTAQVVLTSDLKLGFAPILPSKLYKSATISYGFFESLPAGVKYGWNVLSGYVGDMKYVFTADGAKSVGGFGTIGNLFPAVWDWYMFWKMTAFLSIILAFMNILPIPALDGGHVLFLCYEAITRRKPSEQFMIRAEYVGFGILLLLMVVANLNDILRWLGYM